MNLKPSEIMNVKIPAGSRTLYLDLKQSKDGSKFLSISEVRGSSTSERSRILIDEAYVVDLHRSLTAVLAMLDQNKSTVLPTNEERDLGRSRAYKRWTTQEDNDLKKAYLGGLGVDELVMRHARAPTAIISRLYQLEILNAKEGPRWD